MSTNGANHGNSEKCQKISKNRGSGFSGAKELIERAAAFSGRTVSDFVLAHAELAAKKLIEEREKLQLDQAQSRMLVDALLAPGKPNRKLKGAMARHRKQVQSR